jgi:hypothetical protein
MVACPAWLINNQDMSAEQGYFKSIPISEERYESEKVTRIFPQYLRRADFYKIRVKALPDQKTGGFANEFRACISRVAFYLSEGEFDVGLVFFKCEEGTPIVSQTTKFSEDGFMIARDDPDDPNYVRGQPSIMEIGYVVGSTDPYDIAQAALVAQSRGLASQS